MTGRPVTGKAGRGLGPIVDDDVCNHACSLQAVPAAEGYDDNRLPLRADAHASQIYRPDMGGLANMPA